LYIWHNADYRDTTTTTTIIIITIILLMKNMGLEYNDK
jgi:hypothetical protein